MFRSLSMLEQVCQLKQREGEKVGNYDISQSSEASLVIKVELKKQYIDYELVNITSKQELNTQP